MHPTSESLAFGRVRQAVLLGLFAGLGVGLGHLLAGVPGVELMSTNAALAGVALGPIGGIAVGVLSQLVYSLTSPFGLPMPLLLCAQLAGMGTAGLLGGLLAPALRTRTARSSRALAGAAGVVAAFWFDLLTNLAAARIFDLPLLTVLAGGLLFAAIHAGTAVVAWALLLPHLAARLMSLGRSMPRIVPLVALGLLTATVADAQPARTVRPDSLAAASDSLATAVADISPPDASPVSPTGLPDGAPADWTRPLWQPFHASFHEYLARTTGWSLVRDGGHGSASMILGEPGGTVAPTIWRDGIPLGVGHRWLDEPETVPMAGHSLGRDETVDDIRLVRRDMRPGQDFLDTRWYSGPHDSFLRDVHFLTAKAPWRIGFDFAETIDREGYDFRTPGETRYFELDDVFSTEFWGHFRRRSGRGRLERHLAGGDRLSLTVENARKTRRGVPVYDINQQEYWRNEVLLDWRSPRGEVADRLAIWWTDVDMLLVSGFSVAGGRLLESVRSGATGTWNLAGDRLRLDVRYGRWSLQDSGAGADWAPEYADPFGRVGEEVGLTTTGRTTLLGRDLRVTAAADWARHGDWAVTGGVALGAATGAPGWRLSLDHTRRAPRSDEVATPWRVVVPDGRQTIILPGEDLDRERQWRLAATWARPLLGADLELSASLRQLRHGIGWQADVDDTERGRLVNGVALEAATVRARLAGAWPLLGWLRWEAEGGWHTWRRDDDLELALPPTVQFRLSALWEQRFFAEDGILQLAGYWHNRSTMDDPWFLAAPVALPTLTQLDVIAGFRLIGTNLSVELRNVLGNGEQISANAVAEPMELRWRLHWTFHH